MPRRRFVVHEQLEVLALLFIGGFMGRFWVAVLILSVLVEKIVSGDRLLGYAGGVELILWRGTILRARVA